MGNGEPRRGGVASRETHDYSLSGELGAPDRSEATICVRTGFRGLGFRAAKLAYSYDILMIFFLIRETIRIIVSHSSRVLTHF